MKPTLTVTPAYGRDYKRADTAIADWKAGKDFILATTGQYISSRDVPDHEVWVRYSRMTKKARAQ